MPQKKKTCFCQKYKIDMSNSIKKWKKLKSYKKRNKNKMKHSKKRLMSMLKKP